MFSLHECLQCLTTSLYPGASLVSGMGKYVTGEENSLHKLGNYSSDKIGGI